MDLGKELSPQVGNLIKMVPVFFLHFLNYRINELSELSDPLR